MIIDFHSHTFPDKIAPHALRHMQSLSHNALFTDGTVDALKASMKRAGVTYNVILPVATNPDKVTHINDLSISSTGKDGLIYFGCIHPDFPDYKNELKRIAENGIKGIKLHPLYQGTDIDDIRYMRIVETASELGLIIVTHAGEDPAYLSDHHAHPRMIRHLIDEVKPRTLVCAHMGGLMNWPDVLTYLADTNIYIDTSHALGQMFQDDENVYTEDELQLLTPEDFCNIIKVFGSDRVLFGSDSPWRKQKAALKDLLSLPLSKESFDKILYQNAMALLNL